MAVYRHMRPEVIFGEWFEIDGGNGITFVPADIVNHPLIEGVLEWDGMHEDDRDEFLQYYEGGEFYTVESRSGYGARLSAPGYLDCTEWSVFGTEEEAWEYLESDYDLWKCEWCGERQFYTDGVMVECASSPVAFPREVFYCGEECKGDAENPPPPGSEQWNLCVWFDPESPKFKDFVDYKYLTSQVLRYGDYNGSCQVEYSNVKFLEELHVDSMVSLPLSVRDVNKDYAENMWRRENWRSADPPKLIVFYGEFGYARACVLDSPEARELFTGLAENPVLDAGLMQGIESLWRREAWLRDERSRVISACEERGIQYPHREDLFPVFSEAVLHYGVMVKYTTTAAFIDCEAAIEEVVEYLRLRGEKR